ncbi:MAG: flagellar filament capping protein FliD [Bdellovibrionota bacterium]
MGIRMNPGLQAAGIDPGIVDQLVDAAKIPVETAKKRREKHVDEKKEYEALGSLLGELDGTLNGLKTKLDFYKLRLDSSHPDIIEGTVAAGAIVGNYEMEVRSIARSDKELAYGFPDKDNTPVGFGFMLIEREDKEPYEMIVEPNTTLEQLANQINDNNIGVKAMVVNTKYKPDPYRLLVVSEDSGKESKIIIDPDTTFLEFKEQVRGRNVDILFEDVPITDDDNILDELISDVTLNVKKAEPGTLVQISVVHDEDETYTSIANFVESYNKVASFINQQFQANPETGAYGILSGDSSIKMVMRQLQSTLVNIPQGAKKFRTLADIGITTNPKTGELNIKEAKVREALSEDYDSVAKLFIRTNDSIGVAQVMAERLKGLKNSSTGALKSKIRGVERIIENQDKEIERRQRQMEQREVAIRRQFTALGSTLGELKSQGDFLSAKFGGGGGNKAK